MEKSKEFHVNTTSSEEAIDWLIKNGLREDHWQDIIDLGLYNQEVRTIAEIALCKCSTNTDLVFRKIVENESDLFDRLDNIIYDSDDRA